MLRNFLLSALVMVFAVLPAEAAGPPETAGRVEFVTGDAQFIDAAQQVRRPARGDLLRASDTVITGRDGEVHLDMEDGGYLAVRPNTRLKVKEYRAHGDKGDHVLLYLLKGTFRSFTGWIPNVAPKGYLTETITATIGVRGTDHEPLFIPKDSDIGEPGTYDKVNEGATFIDHASGQVDVLPNTAGFAPLSATGTVRLLERVPDFFRPAPNENLLTGRHKQVQDHLQERLDARRRLYKSPTDNTPNSDSPSEMQEAPAAPKGTDIRDAPDASKNLSGIPAVPASVPAPGVSVTPAAAAGTGIPAVSPAAVAAPAAAAAAGTGAAAAAGTGAAARAGAAAVPAAASAVTPAASAASPAAAAAKAPTASAPLVAPATTEKSTSALVPKDKEADRPRSVSGKPRGVPDTARSIDDKPRPKVTPPAENDREKVYNERRKKQQQDHQDQYGRDRDIEHDRDLDRERDAERDAAKRSREQH